MVRILFIVAWFAASIYAISDWATTPADRMPMKLSRMTWLVILVVTVPFVSLGAIAWIVLTLVANAGDRAAHPPPNPQTPPTEDPEFLVRSECDVQTKPKREEERKNKENPPPTEDEGEGPEEGQTKN